MENSIYSWSFQDTKNRGKLWYIIAISVVIGLCVRGILTRQYGLSFIVVLVAGVTFFIENNSPDIVHVELNDIGISINNSFYEYESIESYHFIYEKESPVFLRLILRKKGLNYVSLNINKEVYTQLNSILPNFLPMGEADKTSTVEKIIHFLKL